MNSMIAFLGNPVFQQVAVLFLLILAGFSLRRFHVIDSGAIRGMNSLIIKLTLPAMIIDSMASQSLSPAVLAESGLILAISFAIYGIMILLSIPIAGLFRSIAKSPPQDLGVIRFVVVFSNVGFMGFPVVEAVFGQEALFYTAIYNLPFNLLVFTLGAMMLLSGHKDGGFKMSWSHLFSPVIISILAGFVLFLLQIELPGVLAKTFKLTGSVTTPLSMILIGTMLGGASLRKTMQDGRLYVISAIRLLVLPLAVFFILRLFVDSYWLAAIPALITAMPAAANTAILAHEYGANETLASQNIFVSTLFSVLTIPVLAGIFLLFRPV